MSKNNPDNERIKRRYFAYLKEARQYSEATVDSVAKALNRFEVNTRYRDFRAFHTEQAIAFKKDMAKQRGAQSGETLSKATLYATMTQLKRFFQWLAQEPGYRSHIHYSDGEYFNLSEKDTRIATAEREPRVPTLEQIKHVLQTMPTTTETELRDRAIIAFTLLTGARDSATASMKLKHIDLVEKCVRQDAREVRTKFSKTFTTYFFPVWDEAAKIVEEWVYLLREQLWSNDDPLFPATHIKQDSKRQFAVAGLGRSHWSNASPIRKIFREAFLRAGLPYFNPHSFRNTLVRLGQDLCRSPEEFKAWSQNLGHEKVLTTFTSYGAVACERQSEILRGLATPQQRAQPGADEFVEAVFQKFRDSGLDIRRAISSCTGEKIVVRNVVTPIA
jgi:integrase